MDKKSLDFTTTYSSESSISYDPPEEFLGQNGQNNNDLVGRPSSSSRRFSDILQTEEDPREVQKYTEEEVKRKLNVKDLDLERIATRTTVLSHIANAQWVEDEGYHIDETRLLVENNGEEFKSIDPELVAWDHNSTENPRNWRLSKKVFVIIIVSLYTFVSPISASIMSPGSKDLVEDFNIDSSTLQALVTSIHILAWAIGPLFISPLSENDRLGRKTVLGLTCWITFVFNLSCAFSQNIAQVLVLRFLSGLFSATPLNVSPAVVSDMFDASKRNVSLAGVFLIPFLGAAIAPVIGGYVVEAKGWRWVLLTLAIINGAIAILGTLLYIETFAPALLYQKAKRLRKASGNPNLHTIYELSGDGTKLMETVCRPLELLFTNPLVFGLGLFMAFIYGFLYLMIVTFPSVFQKTYGFSQGTSGLMFLSLGVGFALGVVLWTILLGKVYTHLTNKNGEEKPEFRLPCLFVSALIMTVGLLWYGWSAQKKLHWIMPCIGSAIFAFGLVCVFQTLQAYLIDVNPMFAASSIAAASIFRFLLGFSFPLFANSMYEAMGYGWGNTMCAILVVLLGIPFPMLCYKYGEQLRAWSNERMLKSEEKRRQRRQEKLSRVAKNI